MLTRTRFLAIAIALILAPSLESRSHAQAAAAKTPVTPATPSKATPEPAETKKPRPLPYQATVHSVNKSAASFTTRTKDGKENVFHLTAATKIEKNGSAATMDDITKGEIVRGSRVKMGEGKWEARKVIIGAKEPAGEGKGKD